MEKKSNIKFEVLMLEVSIKGVDYKYMKSLGDVVVESSSGDFVKGGLILSKSKDISFYSSYSVIEGVFSEFPLDYSKYVCKMEGEEQNNPLLGSSEGFFLDCSQEFLMYNHNKKVFKSLTMEKSCYLCEDVNLEIPIWEDSGVLGKSNSMFWELMKEKGVWKSISDKNHTLVMGLGLMSSKKEKAFMELIKEKSLYYTDEKAVSYKYWFEGLKGFCVSGTNLIVEDVVEGLSKLEDKVPLKMMVGLKEPSKIYKWDILNTLSVGLASVNLFVGKANSLFSVDSFGSMPNSYMKDSSVFKDSASKMNPVMNYTYKDILMGDYEMPPMEEEIPTNSEEGLDPEDEDFEDEDEDVYKGEYPELAEYYEWKKSGGEDSHMKISKKLIKIYSEMESSSKNPFKMAEEDYILEYEKNLEKKKTEE